ncbi:LYR motif-containing protein 5A [Amphibalanus amphitrite]|uniref:LYR motif-containing protein 5A n=1 Tax=Amphibalanus amphitrite TaxID=1232801 RepID=A0A6A4VDJ1_AMPAM|nr:electron transfer flavoprotein regulatory factor 1-like [Amphibalanus amphitrite]KAF0287661.1 LYR motif-containing protein 5A [Amphibalanus amphitrite]KAF0305902.1 LYR motif-containing protein 5A [Amphibalanus amphitrite]
MAANQSRGKVIQAYKNLLHLGKNYPKGYNHFRDTLRAAFEKNKAVEDPEQIRQLLGKCDNIAKELQTLYMLRQYRNVNKHCTREYPKKQRFSN